MDNNNLNGMGGESTQDGGYYEPPTENLVTPNMQPPQSNQNMGYAQPGQDAMNAAFGQQPQPNQNMGYAQPGQDAMNAAFGQQPQPNQNMGYAQPGQDAMNAAFGQQPQVNQGMGYAQPPQNTMNVVFGQQPQVNQDVPYEEPYMNQGVGYGMNYSMPPVPPLNPNDKKVKKVKKPWGKGKIAAVAGGGAVLVAGIACAIILLIVPMLKPAKDVVIDAFENTFDASKRESYMDDVYGLSEIYKKYYSKGGDTSCKMSLSSLDLLAVQDLDKYELVLDSSLNPIDKIVNSSIALEYDGDDIIGLDLIGLEDDTYFAVDELIEGYFKMPNNDIMNELKNSPLGAAMNISDMPYYNMSIDYFTNPETASATDIEIVSEYVNAVEKLWDGVEVSKEGKAKINLHDDTAVAMEYYLTFKEEDIEYSMASVVDGMIRQADSMSEDLADFDVEQYKMALQQMKAAVPLLISNDFLVKVYVKDDKVVKITATTLNLYSEVSDGKDDKVVKNYIGGSMGIDFILDITEDEITLDITMEASGQKIPIYYNLKKEDNDVTGKLHIAAGEDEFNVDIKGTKDEDDSNYKQSWEVKMADGNGDAITYMTEYSLDKNANTFSGEVICSENDDEDIKTTFKGSIFDDEKGVSFGIKVDELTITVAGENEIVITSALSYKIDTSKVSAVKPDDKLPVYDIFKLSESDMEPIIRDNQDRIIDWMSDLNSKYGLFSDVLPYMESDDVDLWNDIITTPTPDPWDEITTPIEPNEPVTPDNEVPDSNNIATPTEPDEPVTSDNKTPGSNGTAPDKDVPVVIRDSEGKDVVRIMSTMEGFHLDGTEEDGSLGMSDEYVSYEDDDFCAIQYMIEEDAAANEIIDECIKGFQGEQGEGVYDVSKASYKDTDGKEIYYFVCKLKSESAENAGTWIFCVFAKDLSDGKVIAMSAYGDEKHLNLEKMLNAMSVGVGYEEIK